MTRETVPTVSVCIPTCNRPQMLDKCLQSALDQTMPPFEIVIGDDSADDATHELVIAIQKAAAIPVRYHRNPARHGLNPNIRAALNIASVFERSSGEFLLLIHDDDWLLPDCLQSLTEPVRTGLDVDVVYGNHLVARHDGTIDEAASAVVNSAFGRVPERAGIQPDALWAAVRQQMPPSFLIRAAVVRRVGYLTAGMNEHEFNFGVRCALAGVRFYFCNRTVWVYRNSQVSLQRSGTSLSALDMSRTVWNYRDPILSLLDQDVVRHVKDILYRGAVIAIRQGEIGEAMKWLLDPRLGLGVEWFGRKGAGIITALLLPHSTREALKRSLMRRIGQESLS